MDVKIITLHEFAEKIQIKPATIRLWIRNGRLTPYGKTPTGRYLFTEAQIAEYWATATACKRP